MAVRIAFRMYNMSDGAFSEYLDQMLGSLITINPQMFLEELKPRFKITERFDALVGNLGEKYVDNEDSSRLKRSVELMH